MVKTKIFGLIFICTLALLGCGDAKEKKVEVKRSSAGYIALGRIANSSIEIYSVADGFDKPLCRAESNFDSQVLDRAGLVTIPRDCYSAGEQLYLVVASGGDDLDANNDGVLDSTSTPVAGTVHGLLRGDDFIAGNWYINPATELIYQYLKGAMAAGIPNDSLLTQANKLAAQIIGDVNGDNSQNYTDVVTWNPFNTALFYRNQQALQDISQAIRDNNTAAINAQTAILLDEIVGTFETLGAGYNGGKGVAVQNNLAYLADGNRGLSVIDVSNPGSAQLIAVFDPKQSQQAEIFANTTRVKVSADLAALCLGDAGVALLDISDPYEITIHRVLDAAPCTGEILIANNHLFVQSDVDVNVYSLADPDNSSLVDSLTADGFSEVLGMGIYNDVLYVLWNITFNGVFTFNVSNPASITAIDNTADSGDILYAFDHHSFKVSGQYLIHSGRHQFDDIGFRIYDIEQGATSNQILNSADYYQGSAAVIDGVLFLADETDGLRRINIHSSDTIALQPNIDISSDPDFVNSAYNVAKSGDFLYVATELGLEVFNFSSGRSPQTIASIALNDYPYDIAVNSTTLAVPSYAGVEIFDISNLPDIGPATDLSGISRGLSVALYDDASYLLEYRPLQDPVTRVTVFDNMMQNPGNFPDLSDNIFRLLGFTEGAPFLIGENHVFERWGDHLTLSSEDGFFDIDISNPLSPSVSRAITVNDADASTYCTSYAIDCSVGAYPQISNVAIYDNIVYGEIANTIHTLDLSNLVSFSFASTGINNTLALDADELYLYSATASAINIYDRSALTLASSIAIDSDIQVVVSDYPRLLALHRDKLTVYDISSFPAQITDTIPTDNAGHVVIRDNYAFIIDGYSGLYVVALKTLDVP